MPLLETDPVDWELTVPSNDLVFPLRYIRGTPAVAQRIRVKFRMIRGEWFADRSVGIPWLEGPTVEEGEAILGNPFDRPRVEAILRTEMLAIDGVESILEFSATFNNSTRELDVSYVVLDIFGQQIAGTFSQGVLQ